MPTDGQAFRRQLMQFARDQADNIGDALGEEWDSMVNAIEEYREIDCGGEWTVYVRTFLPAVASALWLLLTPSPSEILENYLNPKSGRGGSRRGRRARRRWRAGNRGQRRLFFGNGIPDIDEEIAKRLPGGRFARGRRIGPGEWLFFTGIDVADRILWYWLVWEASETFLTTWHSELVESGECRSGSHDLQCAAPFRVNEILDPFNWWEQQEHVLDARCIGVNVGASQITTVGNTPADGEVWGETEYTFKNIFPENTFGNVTVRFWVDVVDKNGLNKQLDPQTFNEFNWDGQEERTITYVMRGEFQNAVSFKGRFAFVSAAGDISLQCLDRKGHLSVLGNLQHD